MLSPLSLTSGTPGLQMPAGLAAAGTPPAGNFQEALLQSWQQMQGVQGDAQQAVQAALGSDDPSLVETFTADSWIEHLRQHERITVSDRVLRDVARGFHVGEEAPVVTHLVGASVRQR